ncbi:uncharacterized protein LOC122512076 [Leptopilina heterotoma]|uniref:uncharacterized protein LOC122512076 n=1 Tax=Leptopilina heterotoma TaxID=63436 RepID=UPI001CA9A8E9|nr:uncharacterized protein LOC122512076 [Leptopilina heterotoma]
MQVSYIYKNYISDILLSVPKKICSTRVGSQLLFGQVKFGSKFQEHLQFFTENKQMSRGSENGASYRIEFVVFRNGVLLIALTYFGTRSMRIFHFVISDNL